MLHSLYKDAVKNREKIIDILNNPEIEKLKNEAKKSWNEHIPKPEKVIMAGIDSSFNTEKFQGVELWATDAVAVKINEEIVCEDFDYGLKTNAENIPRIASLMEIKLCDEAKDNVDLVLMDGSISSYFQFGYEEIERKIKIAMRKDNVVFISKTSSTVGRFKEFGVNLGDIYFYNYGTDTIGFSDIFETRDSRTLSTIAHVFARLSNSVPLIKIELFGKNHTNDDFKEVINKISMHMVRGYPYELKLAHNRCKIWGKDMKKLVSLYGMTNLIGSREVLG
ncbi:MAG: DNA double-strand break repair nuclease NurA [Nitrosopumilus sp.]|nr:DNA double-strand break repair nuclease NurA [Nitrosopumilus sp.]